jgi:hypothetical protein
MLETYIKNRGKTKTLMYDNHRHNVNELKWDADYDGKVANVSLDLLNNGKRGHYDVQLNNKDIADILNISSVNTPLERRLHNDYKSNNFNVYKLQYDDDNFKPYPLVPMREIEISMMNAEPPKKIKKPSIEELIKMAQSRDTDDTNPANKEYIIPLTFDNNKMRNPVFIPQKKPKTHKIYKVYNIYKKKSKNHSKKHHSKKHHTKKRRSKQNKSYKLTTFPFI